MVVQCLIPEKYSHVGMVRVRARRREASSSVLAFPATDPESPSCGLMPSIFLHPSAGGKIHQGSGPLSFRMGPAPCFQVLHSPPWPLFTFCQIPLGL